MKVMAKLMLSLIILMKSSKKNLVILDIEGIVYGFCDPEIASKENKTDSEEH